jgi:hypothetical protein
MERVANLSEWCSQATNTVPDEVRNKSQLKKHIPS